MKNLERLIGGIVGLGILAYSASPELFNWTLRGWPKGLNVRVILTKSHPQEIHLDFEADNSRYFEVGALLTSSNSKECLDYLSKVPSRVCLLVDRAPQTPDLYFGPSIAVSPFLMNGPISSSGMPPLDDILVQKGVLRPFVSLHEQQKPDCFLTLPYQGKNLGILIEYDPMNTLPEVTRFDNSIVYHLNKKNIEGLYLQYRKYNFPKEKL